MDIYSAQEMGQPVTEIEIVEECRLSHAAPFWWMRRVLAKTVSYCTQGITETAVSCRWNRECLTREAPRRIRCSADRNLEAFGA